MKPVEAEKLLGGYATGTLTEAERQALFAAALDHQEVFDALADEEVLRDLLADPAARAQLLAALSADFIPKVVPFWRRTGVLGAAASLLVASLAGLVYLRSPEKAPPSVRQEEAKAPSVALSEPASPAPLMKPVPAEKKKGDASPRLRVEAPAPPPPAPMQQQLVAPTAGVSAAVVADAAREKASEPIRAEAKDNLARKAEAPRPAALQMEAVGAIAPAPPAKKAKALGGVVPASATVPQSRSWGLSPLPDGSTRVTVTASHRSEALLKRGTAGVEVLKLLEAPGAAGSDLSWTCQVRLIEGDVLDLYLLNTATADPALLPEAGPVDGYRARIHPAVKKEPVR